MVRNWLIRDSCIISVCDEGITDQVSHALRRQSQYPTIHLDYDQKGLFEAQKEVYHPEIDLQRRISDLNHNNFKLKPL